MKNQSIFLILMILASPIARAEDTPVTTEESPASPSAYEMRMKNEERGYDNPWSILPYRANYILFASYARHMNDRPYRDAGLQTRLEHFESKYQISFKFPLWTRAAGGRGTLFLGYTQLSLWQVYNGKESNPMRETNYQPELFFTFKTNRRILGLTNRAVSAGYSHESNGRGPQTLSRSWERLWASCTLEKGNFILDLKPWWRIPESNSSDDNPHIERYVGYGELRAAYNLDGQVISVMARNNLRGTNNKGAIEIGYSFPLTARVKGYVQYFSGYAETLADYNVPIDRFGVGILLADWL